MLARGYEGAMPQLEALAFRRADALFVSVVAGSLLLVRLVVGEGA
jgi:hypothetical protein